MTFKEIRQRVQPGQRYAVTNHQHPMRAPVDVLVTRLSGEHGFYVGHALGETKVNWPPSRHVTLDEDGTLHLLGTGVDAGKPFLMLVPVVGEAHDG